LTGSSDRLHYAIDLHFESQSANLDKPTYGRWANTDFEVSMTRRNNSRVGAIILAAGKSTRMGVPKQLLLLGESTVLEQTLDNIRGAGLDEIVLVLGSSAETIQQYFPAATFEGLKVVVNKAYREGMASSLREGLSALHPQIDAALIVLADQPFLQPETFGRIVDQYRRSSAQIVIPTYKGFRGNPVLLDRSVFPEVMALGGDVGCRAIFGSHLEGIAKVEVEDVGILLDIDDQADYERLRRFGQSKQEDVAQIEAATSEARVIPGLEGPGAEDSPKSDELGELIVVGWEPVAISVVKLGTLLNFRVTVVDPRLEISDLPPGVRLLNALDFSLLADTSESNVVVASRGKFDEEAIEQALKTRSAYVGLVANKRRGQEILGSLERRGVPADTLATVRVPAGVDIGAETPEEIALSILAEIVSRRKKKRLE
jgi:molybdenum cofactor cytidylyltransferase